jgi:hypothetical protein
MSQRESASTSSIKARKCVDRIRRRHLLVEIPPEDLDVARFVHHLCRRVVLRIDPRHGLDDASRAQERTLFAVEELAHAVRDVFHRVVRDLLFAPRADRRIGLVDQGTHVLHAPILLRELNGGAFGIDVNRPVEVGRAVPLRCLGLLVELVECGPRALAVVPRDGRVEGRPNGVRTFVVGGVDLRQDRFEIVVSAGVVMARCSHFRSHLSRSGFAAGAGSDQLARNSMISGKAVASCAKNAWPPS